jgi:hypothetical protein
MLSEPHRLLGSFLLRRTAAFEENCLVGSPVLADEEERAPH